MVLDDQPADILSNLGNYGVTEGVDWISHQSAGNPISHASHAGFARPVPPYNRLSWLQIDSPSRFV